MREPDELEREPRKLLELLDLLPLLPDDEDVVTGGQRANSIERKPLEEPELGGEKELDEGGGSPTLPDELALELEGRDEDELELEERLKVEP